MSSDCENKEESPVFLNHGPISTFLVKLWELANSDSRVVTWSPNGKSILVDQKNSKNLSKCFKSGLISSFVRQLNMYGFKKVVRIFQSTGLPLGERLSCRERIKINYFSEIDQRPFVRIRQQILYPWKETG